MDNQNRPPFLSPCTDRGLKIQRDLSVTLNLGHLSVLSSRCSELAFSGVDRSLRFEKGKACRTAPVFEMQSLEYVTQACSAGEGENIRSVASARGALCTSRLPSFGHRGSCTHSSTKRTHAIQTRPGCHLLSTHALLDPIWVDFFLPVAISVSYMPAKAEN